MKVKLPVKSGIARVPMVMQMENVECGAAALCMILAYYGKWVSLFEMRDLVGISRDGAKLSSLVKAGRSFGMTVTGRRGEVEDFFRNATFPCIVHWQFNHFCVCCGRRGKYVYFNDPARGEVKLTLDEFDEGFTGVYVCMAPGEGFVPGGRQKSIWEYVRENLKGAKAAILFVGIATLVMSLAGAMMPALTRVFVDRVLSGRSPSWATGITALMVILCIVMLVTGWTQSVYQMKLFGLLGIKSGTRYMWHVFHLPQQFFFQRNPGDLQQNEAATQVIAQIIINQVVPLAINTVMMVYYAVVMLLYSRVLAFMGFAVIAVNLLLSAYLFRKKINIIRGMRKSVGKMMSTSMSAVGMNDTIKASGAENAYFCRWSRYQADVCDENARFEKETQIWGSIPMILIKLSGILVLCGGICFVIQGHFTAGMVMAFQSYMTAFMNPAQQTVGIAQRLQEMRADMERIEDTNTSSHKENLT